MKSLFLSACAVVVLAVPSVQAQVITNGEIERGLRYPGPAFDGEAYSQRYSYNLGQGMIYVNGDARRLWYMDYLDRADRAEKFGYRMPIDPYFEAPTPVTVVPAGRVYLGGGFGLWRRR